MADLRELARGADHCNQPRLRNGVGIICAALGLWAALYVGAF